MTRTTRRKVVRVVMPADSPRKFKVTVLTVKNGRHPPHFPGRYSPPRAVKMVLTVGQAHRLQEFLSGLERETRSATSES